MCKDRLDEANIQLGKELFEIKCSLDIYILIGLNANEINSKPGKRFFGFVQQQSLAAVVIGLAKVFEREDKYELCSVTGVYKLAKQVDIQNISAVQDFIGEHGITASEEWVHDVDRVFSAKRPWIKNGISVINRVRNTRFAHIQQDAVKGPLPSIETFEGLLGFAHAFHAFVNKGFLNTTSHPTLDDQKMQFSLLRLFKEIGMSDPVSQFQ